MRKGTNTPGDAEMYEAWLADKQVQEEFLEWLKAVHEQMEQEEVI